MLRKWSAEAGAYYAQAETAGRKAKAAPSTELRNRHLRSQQSLLTLARSHELAERLIGFSSGKHRRRIEFYGDHDAPGFFHKGQRFLEPIRCERCRAKSDLIRRTPNASQPGGEIRTFSCRGCEHLTKITVAAADC